MQSHTQFANRGEKSPCSRAIQFEDGVEARYAHLNAVAGRLDDLMKVQPLQVLLEVNDDV